MTNNPEAEIYLLAYRCIYDIPIRYTSTRKIQKIPDNFRLNTAKVFAYLHYTIIIIRRVFGTLSTSIPFKLRGDRVTARRADDV